MNPIAAPVFTRFDDIFTIHSSRNYCLSMLVSRHSFSFCISRPEDKVILGLESHNFKISDNHLPAGGDNKEWCNQLSKVLGSLESLKKSFRKVCIAVQCPKSTLVPASLFVETDQDVWLSFNHQVADYELSRQDALSSADAIMLYAVPECILAVLETAFPEADIYNASGQLINSLLANTREAARDGTLYAHIQGSWLELVYLEAGLLKYFNIFSYHTREDLAYYVIFVMEQLRLNPDTTVLVLLGEIAGDSGDFELLYRYIRNISLIDHSIMQDNFILTDVIPFHIYFNLINFARCGS